jgi:hypothetical protein
MRRLRFCVTLVGMGRLIAWTALLVVAVIAVGVVAIAVLNALLGAIGYLIAGALVIGGGAYLYSRGKRALTKGTRTRNRLDAAAYTYRTRNH